MTISECCQYSRLIEVKIGHEFSLINYRITVFVACSIVLFAAAGLVLVTTIGPLQDNPQLRDYFLLCISVLGVSIGTLTTCGILAANDVLAALFVSRGQLEDHLRDIEPLIGFKKVKNRSYTDFFGALPSLALPLVLMIVWFILILTFTIKSQSYCYYVFWALIGVIFIQSNYLMLRIYKLFGSVQPTIKI